MKHFAIFFKTLFLAALVFSSCKDDALSGIEPDTRLRFSIVTAEEGVVNTRANSETAEDAAINNVYVLVFENATENARLVNWAAASTPGQGIYYATLDKNILEGTIYVLANIETDMAGGTAFPPDITLADLKSQLIVQLLLKNGQIVEAPHFAPMVSEAHEYKKDDPTIPTLKLHRSTAKVIVSNISQNARYKLQGANLAQAPTQGYVFMNQGNIRITANYAGHVSGTEYSIETMMSGISTTNPLQTKPLYMFESAAENGTFVIIKGEYNGVTGFHRLNLWDENKQNLSIKRNYQYIVNIKKIATGGYSTAEEAMKNAASNRDIVYDITVSDSLSHDIISNGEQYLGVSNSSLILYRTGALNNIKAATVSYTTNSTWNTGTITAIGNGLTLATATGNGKTLAMALGTTKDKEIKINCTESFTSGSLVFHVGDLSKVITITRNQDLPAIAEEIEFTGQTVGDCSNSGSIKNHIHFSDKPGNYTEQGDLDVFTSKTSNLYVFIGPNIGYKDNMSGRDGEFYVASAKDEGRTKVIFHQKKIDVYYDRVQIEPYTYVGTFHRWNQTAERIIRIKTTDEKPAKWTAIVVAGQDFIELDSSRSPDPGITQYPYGCNDFNNPAISDAALYTSDQDIENYCQFTPAQKGKSLITGYGNNIYFRVGMKSKLDNAQSQPRYGLIALVHKKGNHLIYVRQGEAADYLMRPADPMTDYSGRSRQAAVKISPYNLTVPDAQKGKPFYDIPKNGGVWTKYPSQGGYLFKGNDNRAYCSINVALSTLNWTTESGGQSWEICPDGFRSPNDEGGLTSVNKSELRQSFWLFPQTGYASSNFSNMLRGYIADGYYDRRAMRVPGKRPNEEHVTSYTIVPTLVEEGANAAFAGALLFNPVTYASIFLPGTGSYDNNVGIFRRSGIGSGTDIWSTTFKASSFLHTLSIGTYAGIFVFDNYYGDISANGFSIRGVTK